MLIALARYGRQSLMQWDDVDVREVIEWYERLKELFDDEKPSDNLTED